LSISKRYMARRYCDSADRRSSPDERTALAGGEVGRAAAGAVDLGRGQMESETANEVFHLDARTET
jgi:hypothetical protein